MNWQELSRRDYDELWAKADDMLSFRPYLYGAPMRYNGPQIKIKYGKCLNNFKFEELKRDMNKKTIDNLNSLKIRSWIAMSWQHPCYEFEVDKPFEVDEFGDWLVPIIANGDYNIICSHDFENGIFADGIYHQIVVWGTKLTVAYKLNEPTIFTGCSG
jgi:Protein of unknown function (DUF2716)